MISAGMALIHPQILHVQLMSPFPFAQLMISMDALAAFMVMVISLLVVAASIYALHYLQEYLEKGAWGSVFSSTCLLPQWWRWSWSITHFILLFFSR
ncbi:hypothetical protein P4S72_02685 [Vibrio sp. PP-XX7]